MPENTEVQTFEDISSYSKKKAAAKKVADKANDVIHSEPVEKVVKAIDNYGNGAEKYIDKIIKVLAFVVALGILMIFAAVATILVIIDKFFMLIAIGIGILGLVISLICLFLIYGTGHIIAQNNEILKRLK